LALLIAVITHRKQGYLVNAHVKRRPIIKKGFVMFDPAISDIAKAPHRHSAGHINFFDRVGNVVDTTANSDIEQVICFTPGTLISTAKGMRPVEDIQVGERLITRDNGFKELAWVGRKNLDFRQLRQTPNLCPVTISAGSLGNGLPLADMTVSPNHRVFMLSAENRVLFDEAEVLIPARKLVGLPGITQDMPKSVSYIHLMCEEHELILSDGFWTESFQPTTEALVAIDGEQRDELFTIFPELCEEFPRTRYHAARMSLKDFEADVALDAMRWN
jgi:hypothetical protein